MAPKLPTERIKSDKNLNAGQVRMRAILDRLGKEFKPWRPYTDDPFLLLVGTVLSQNTNDRNSLPAYERLVAKFKTPEQITGADEREIQELIRRAGLYKIKSKRLKEISRVVLEKYDGDLSRIMKKPTEDARKELLSLPGVGFKTADVVLAFGAGRGVFPVDTHVFRVSKRLGFANKNDDHEQVKQALEAVTPPGRRIKGHVFLIQLGRRHCRARNPLHSECPINSFCPIGIRAKRSRP
jgi:endonuclease III